MKFTYEIQFPRVIVFLNNRRIGYIERRAGLINYHMYYDSNASTIALDQNLEDSKKILEKELNKLCLTINGD